MHSLLAAGTVSELQQASRSSHARCRLVIASLSPASPSAQPSFPTHRLPQVTNERAQAVHSSDTVHLS